MATLTSNIFIGLTAWATGSVKAAGAMVSSGGGGWRTTAGGITGVTAPTGTGPTFNDGVVTWNYCANIDYTSINAWVASIPSTLTQNVVGALWNTGLQTVNGTSIGTISGGHTLAGFTITLGVAAGESLDASSSNALAYAPTLGVAITNTSGGYTPALIVSENCIIQGIQFNSTTAGTGNDCIETQGSGLSLITIDRCLFNVKSANGNACASAMITAAFSASLIKNSVFIETGTTGTNQTCSISTSGGHLASRVANCTFIATAGTVGAACRVSYDGVQFTNCTFFGFASLSGKPAYSKNATLNCITNLASFGANDVDTGSLFSKVAANQFTSTTTDLRIKAGADVINAGNTDTTDIPGSTDFYGTTRPSGQWTMGAHQYVASGGSVGSAVGAAVVSGVGAAFKAAVGAAVGAAVVSGAGRSVVAAVGSAAGTGNALGVGTGLTAAVGVALGAGVVAGIGAANVAGVGSAAGIAVVSGVSAGTAAAVGAAAGAAVVSGVGASTMAGVASAAGVGNATATGTAIISAVGNAAGAAGVSGIGTGIVPAAFQATGVSNVLAVGAAAAQAVANALGAGIALGVGTALKTAVGNAAGVATVSGVSAGVSQGVGNAAGVAVVTGAAAALFPAVGNAAGIGAAVGVGTAVVAAAGSALGVGVAAAVGVTIRAAVGSASGSAGVAGVATAIIPSVAAAAGVGVALGVGGFISSSVGNAAGVGVAHGISPAQGASVKLPFAHPYVEVSSRNESQHRKQMAEGINRVTQGKMNVTVTVTLKPSSATTTVLDSRISFQSAIGLHPLTASAAVEAGAGNLWTAPTNGSVVIHHTNNAATDRTFTLTILG